MAADESPESEVPLGEATVPPPPTDPAATVAPDTHATQPPDAFRSPTAVDPLTRIGRYEIVRELARGGMGIIYVARDTQLDREVALKVMRSGAHAGTGERERFSIEARAAARLVHPNIVAILDVGEERGRPYFAMELIKGESLKERISRLGHLDPRQAATFAKTLAEALYYAHSQAILHRDMKPDNVLLSETDEPLITDFGIAKDFRSEAPGLTKTGQLMGTPGYMPPEQANGELDRIDRRADVYSLGATLYAMLVGRAPFVGSSTINTVAKVLNQEPVSPRKLRPEVDRDITTICLKALEKEPERRYVSAQALAADLGRYLAHESISARPPTAAERVQKWVRRNRKSTRVLIASAAVSIAVGVCGTALFVSQLQAEKERVKDALTQAREAESQAREAEAQAKTAEAQAKTAEAQAKEQRALAEEAAENAKVEAARATASMKEVERRIGDVQDEKARGLAEHGEWAQAAALLADALLRADLPKRRGRLLETLANLPTGRDLLGHAKSVTELVFSPDSTRLASASLDRSVRVWSLAGDAAPVVLPLGAEPKLVAWSPDGARLAISLEKTVQVWNLAPRERVAELSHARVKALAWSPDGALLACGGIRPSVTVWSTAGFERLALHEDHKARVQALAFSADSTRLATGCYDGFIRVRSASNGWAGESRPRAHTRDITALQFFPSAPVLASASGDQSIKLWSTDELELLTTLTGHGSRVSALRWTSDGKGIVSASTGGNARVWRHVKGPVFRLEALLSGGHSSVNWLGITDDGERIATIGARRARLWSRFGSPQGTIEPLHDNRDRIGAGALSGDGGHLALATRHDSTVHLYDTSRTPFVALRWHDRELRQAIWTANGERVLVQDRPGQMTLWNARRAVPVQRLNHTTQVVQRLSVSPDGRRMVGQSGFTAHLWDGLTGEHLATLEAIVRTGHRASFAPDGSQIAIGDSQRGTRIFDRDGKSLRLLLGHEGVVIDQAYSPDGARLATGGRDKTVRLWDTATGKPLLVLSGCQAPVGDVAWSPDGQRLAAADWRSRVVVWDTTSGKVLADQVGAGRTLAWSSDGRLATGGPVSKRVWVWSASQELATTEFVGATRIAWSNDGRHLAAVRGSGAAILWDGSSANARSLGTDCSALAWSPTHPRLAFCIGTDVAICDPDGTIRVRLPTHTAKITSLAWSPDGQRLLSASEDRAAILWDTDLALLEPKALAALALERTGLQVDLLNVSPRGR